MRKFIFIFILIFILSSCSTSTLSEPTIYYKLPQVHRTSLNTNLENNNFLYPIEENELYGFININGEIIIEPKFTRYSSVDKGYYLAYTADDNFTGGLSNPINGTYLISPGNKVIKISDKDTYINLTSSKKYAIIYDEVYENNDVTIYNYIYDLVNEKEIASSDENKEIISAYDDFYVSKISGLYYILNYSGEIISEGYSSFEWNAGDTLFFRDDNTTYWIDKSGKSFFKYDYCNYALPFYEDVAAIITKNFDLLFIDKDNNILNAYSNILSIYRENNFYFAYSNTENTDIIFDTKGNKKLFESYLGKILYYEPSSNYITTYNEASSDFYIFDKDANIKETFKIPEGYKEPSLLYDYLRIEKDLLYGLGTVKNGQIEWVLEPKYTTIYGDNSYVVVFKSSTLSYGLFDLENKKFILDPNYPNIFAYDKNMIYVESAYFKGYIHANGEYVYVKSSYGFTDD